MGLAGIVTLNPLLVLVAFFVVPPVFDHYFGTADVELGHEHRAEGRALRVVEARRVAADGQEFPGVFEVELVVTASRTWTPEADNFSLELTTGGDRLALLPPDPARPETSLAMPLGQERRLVLRFAGTARRDTAPRILHVSDPRARFHLQPGEPGE